MSSTKTTSVTSADGTDIVFHTVGQGPPLVMVPGTLAVTGMYEPIAEQLSSAYQVVMIERRAYGISGPGDRPGEMIRQAEDLMAVLGTLDAPAYVFGHSFGGVATLHTMAEFGPAISRIALYEPPATLVGPALAPVRDECRELLAAGNPVGAVLRFLGATDGNTPPAAAMSVASVFAFRADGMLADLECISGMDPDLTRWGAIDTPALLLTGSNSDPASTKLLDQILPDTRVTVLPGLGHYPDNPVLVAEALREFFVA